MDIFGIDIYIVPTSDYHQSEYVGEYFKSRQYMTGFTGSAGTAVFTKESAFCGRMEDILYRQKKSFKEQGSYCKKQENPEF